MMKCGKEGVSVHVHGGRLCAVVESGPPNERRQADGAMGGTFSHYTRTPHQFPNRTLADEGNEWELLVGWHGLEDAEDSWESMGGIVKAVPDIVKAFVETCDNARLIRHYNEKFEHEAV
ncbi:putative Chromo-like domain superfamily protein [Plasmopara halstedii]